MSWMRPLVCLVVVATVTIAGPAAAGLPADDYRAPVDITFPAGPGTTYGNDYADARSGGRVHRATDIFGPAGNRIVAARGGTVVWLPTTQASSAGWAIQILGDDGRVYAYYHLGRAGRPRGEAIAPAVRLGGQVARGQFIARLGDSGNAAGGSPHLHFEIHDTRVVDPFGGIRRNPYASLLRAQGKPIGDIPDVRPPAETPRTRTLHRGDEGPRVARWQRRLNRVQANDITVDGQFGPGTEQATISFQRTHGLGPAGLGIVGPRTRAAMRADLRALREPPAPPASRPPAHDGRLRRGDGGAAVLTWQRQLNRVNRVDIVADGQFGPGTEQATISFQRAHGLGPRGLGVVGPRTRTAMRRALRALQETSVPAATAPLLRLGSRGPAVTAWQRQLNRVQANDISVDGQFGPGTEQATIDFQRAHGLGPAGLGVVGPRTRAAMRRALA